MNLGQFTQDGKFLMLALDHRGSFKKLINPQDPDLVSGETVINLKNDIIEALKDQFSALLIDETWGLEACHEVCQVKPFLLPLEKSEYTDQAGERITELEYSVEQIKAMRASGAKLLLYFNPGGQSAGKQIEIARKVMEDCKANDFPFFLEIVTYNNTGSSIGNRYGIVNRSVGKFMEADVIPDVWKLEYPGSAEQSQELTKLVGDVPWILLTGGQTFEEFKPELEVASQNGAKGFLAGRALWQEVCKLAGESRQKFLKDTLPARFQELTQVATNY